MEINPSYINQENNEIIFQNKENLSISEKISLILSNNESLMSFKIVDLNEFPEKEYELLVNIEQLYQINNYFKMFNCLNDIKKCLINEYQNKRLTLKINENNAQIIISNIILNNKFEINIPLIDKPIDNKLIYSKIKEMKQKIECLENENKEIKKQMNEKNKAFENKIKSLEKVIEQLQDNIEKISNESYQDPSQLINIRFDETTGFKSVLSVSKYISFKKLFKLYAKKRNINENLLGEGILFLYNCAKLDVNSEEILSKIFYGNNYFQITVFDPDGLLLPKNN